MMRFQKTFKLGGGGKGVTVRSWQNVRRGFLVAFPSWKLSSWQKLSLPPSLFQTWHPLFDCFVQSRKTRIFRNLCRIRVNVFLRLVTWRNRTMFTTQFSYSHQYNIVESYPHASLSLICRHHERTVFRTHCRCICFPAYLHIYICTCTLIDACKTPL